MDQGRDDGLFGLSKAEDQRIDALVAAEMSGNPFASRRRGMRDIWDRVERDIEKQTAFNIYS